MKISKKWIKEYQSDNENWKRDEEFNVNGHSIKTKSNQANHIIIDNMMVDLSPKVAYVINNKALSTIDHAIYCVEKSNDELLDLTDEDELGLSR